MNIQEEICPQCSEHIKFYVQALIIDSRGRVSYQCGTCGYRWSDETEEWKQVMKSERRKIDWDKPLRVKATGRPVRILCRDFKSIFGLRYVVAATNSHGKEDTFYCKENDNRVENISEKQEAWINIHEKVFGRVTQSTHPTKAVADAMAGECRIARIKIEYEEGQFDE